MPRKKEEKKEEDTSPDDVLDCFKLSDGPIELLAPVDEEKTPVKKVSKYIGKIKAEKDKLNIFLKNAGLGQNARENVSKIVNEIEKFVKELTEEE